MSGGSGGSSSSRSYKDLVRLYAERKRERAASGIVDLVPPPVEDGPHMRVALMATREFAPRPRPAEELKVCIVGGGMAGLYTALLLKTLNIPYKLYEASDR